MRRLFNLFAASALVQSELIAPVKVEYSAGSEIDPCLEGATCNSTETAEACTTCWGPEHGYPPIPDDNVTELCFTTPPPEGLGCCSDDKSSTGYSDCIPPPPPPKWKGCKAEESLQYCNVSAIDEDKCFTDCCQDDTSPTQYADCPEAPFPGYAAFFISQGGLLTTSAVYQTVALCKQASETVKKVGWIALGSTAVATIGAGITWGVKGSAAVTVGPVAGVLSVAIVAGCFIYKKLTPAVGVNVQQHNQSLLEISDVKVAGHHCCTVRCC